MKTLNHLLVLSLFVAPALYAEDSMDSVESIEGTPEILQDFAQKGAGTVTGGLEIRPAYSHAGGRLHTLNTLEAGYKFSPDFSLDYTQYFVTNVYDPAGKATGLGLKADDGFLRAKFSNVWNSVSKDLNLGFESRVYLPTDAAVREKGMLLAWRNYASLTKRFSDQVSVILQEIPVLYGFSQAGAVSEGKASANPVFENRIYLIPSIDFTKKLNLSFPILFHFTRNRAYDAAALNNDKWTYRLWIWPQLSYLVAPKTTIGLAFMSENMIQPDLSAFNLFGGGGGMSQGVTQLVLRQDL